MSFPEDTISLYIHPELAVESVAKTGLYARPRRLPMRAGMRKTTTRFLQQSRAF